MVIYDIGYVFCGNGYVWNNYGFIIFFLEDNGFYFIGVDLVYFVIWKGINFWIFNVGVVYFFFFDVLYYFVESGFYFFVLVCG